MREIKFRGRCIETKEWVYGYYVPYHEPLSNHGWIHTVDFEEHPELPGNPVEDLTDITAVDDDTVGQYTGLRDKNGKEIYEGDLIRFEGSFNLTVSFRDGTFCYNAGSAEFPHLVPLSNHNFQWDNNRGQKIEVIGNIYETPELLTQ